MLYLIITYKRVRNFGDIASKKSQVVYTSDFELQLRKIGTKIASSCVAETSCVQFTFKRCHYVADIVEYFSQLLVAFLFRCGKIKYRNGSLETSTSSGLIREI